MRIRIDNFAKIKHADILIDGITVITGENNTGKSTVGKVLYSIFNSLYNLDAEIENKREQEIADVCFPPMLNLARQNKMNITYSPSSRRIFDKVAKDIAKELMELDADMFDEQTFGRVVIKHFQKYGVKSDYSLIEDYIEATYKKVVSRMERGDHAIALEIIQRFFNQIFNSKINCLNLPDEETSVSLTIKDKDIVIGFKENECVLFNADYNILHEAFFLDDPFILDDISNDYYFMSSSRGIRGQLKKKLQDADSDIMDGLFDAIDAKEKLKEIYTILDKVTEGDVIIQNGKWDLDTKQYNEPFDFENLSAGLKAFMLIKLLLEKGILKEKDVLILDEPEIHLHPEWQLLYAEIIVLLQKKFDLSLVVTTHSSHFLEAVECYSKKYEIAHKCNYYLANMENGLAAFENVTSCINKIYRQMVTPSMLLDKLKYEMEHEDE